MKTEQDNKPPLLHKEDGIVVVKTGQGPQKMEVVIRKGENGEPGEVIRIQTLQN